VAFFYIEEKERRRTTKAWLLTFFILGIYFTGTGTVFMTSFSPAFIRITGPGITYMKIFLAMRDK